MTHQDPKQWFAHPNNKQVIVDVDGKVIAVVRAPGNRNDIGDTNAERILTSVNKSNLAADDSWVGICSRKDCPVCGGAEDN